MLFRRKKKKYEPQRNKLSLTIPENDDSWPAIEELLDENTTRVYRLKVDDDRALEVYNKLGISQESHMGALLLHTAGILVDGGWVRILGSGTADGFPALGEWTPRGDYGRPHYMTIAYDVLGGIFAIDGGSLGINIGYVCYFDPARLEWTPLAPDYAGFLNWLFSDASEQLYEQWRWEGWQQTVQGLDFNQGLRIDPPVHSEQFSPDPAGLQFEPCAIEELWDAKFIAAGDKVSVPPPHK